jgi:hypothetical protein
LKPTLILLTPTLVETDSPNPQFVWILLLSVLFFFLLYFILPPTKLPTPGLLQGLNPRLTSKEHTSVLAWAIEFILNDFLMDLKIGQSH